MSSCVLAIETSSARGGIAVARDGEVVFERYFTSERSHNSQLFAPLGEALELCAADLRTIVVGLGPGSYTGARIGIAAAQGIALSRGVALIGLPSVLAPDVVDLPRDFVVCGDARRGMCFRAEVRDGMLADEIKLLDADAFRTACAADASGTWFSYDQKRPLDVERVVLTSPSAARLAMIAAAMPDESVWSLEQRALEPLYLAAPFITKAKR